MKLTPELEALGVKRVQGKDNGKLVCLMVDGTVQHLDDAPAPAPVANLVISDDEIKAHIENLTKDVEALTVQLSEEEGKVKDLEKKVADLGVELEKANNETKKAVEEADAFKKAAADQAEEIKNLKAKLAAKTK